MRFGKCLSDRTAFHHLATVEHNHLVTVARDDAGVVSDENDGGVEH